MAGSLSLAIRTLHLFGMVVLLGGAAALWYRYGAAEASEPLARRYEWAFWGVLGVMVVTGVGNLGALGAPGPETRWGAIFLGKLVLVVALVLGSLVRTVVVARASTEDVTVSAVGLRRAYGATTVTLATLVVLAEVLAHG